MGSRGTHVPNILCSGTENNALLNFMLEYVHMNFFQDICEITSFRPRRLRCSKGKSEDLFKKFCEETGAHNLMSGGTSNCY